MEQHLVAAQWGGKTYLARLDGTYGVAVIERAMTAGDYACAGIHEDYELHRLADDGGPAE